MVIETPNGGGPVAAVVPGLMDRSRFPEGSVVFVTSAVEVDGLGAARVLIDLDRVEHPESFIGADRQIVGFGSHVDAERLEAARALDFDLVLARSVFFRRLPELIRIDAPLGTSIDRHNAGGTDGEGS